MSQKYISRLLRYNLTERKTLQSYKLNCFIWTASNVLNKEHLLKAAQHLLLINLIKPTTVCISPAHHWHNLTAVSKVLWNEQSSTVTLSLGIAFKTVVAPTTTTTPTTTQVSLHCIPGRRTHTSCVVFVEITLEGFMDHSQGDWSWCQVISGVGRHFGLAG